MPSGPRSSASTRRGSCAWRCRLTSGWTEREVCSNPWDAEGCRPDRDAEGYFFFRFFAAAFSAFALSSAAFSRSAISRSSASLARRRARSFSVFRASASFAFWYSVNADSASFCRKSFSAAVARLLLKSKSFCVFATDPLREIASRSRRLDYLARRDRIATDRGTSASGLGPKRTRAMCGRLFCSVLCGRCDREPALHAVLLDQTGDEAGGFRLLDELREPGSRSGVRFARPDGLLHGREFAVEYPGARKLLHVRE